MTIKYVVSPMSKSKRVLGRHSIYVHQSGVAPPTLYAQAGATVEGLGDSALWDLIETIYHTRGTMTWEINLKSGIKVSTEVSERFCDVLNTTSPDGAEFILETEVKAFEDGTERPRTAAIADVEHALEGVNRIKYHINAMNTALNDLSADAEALEGRIRKALERL